MVRIPIKNVYLQDMYVIPIVNITLAEQKCALIYWSSKCHQNNNEITTKCHRNRLSSKASLTKFCIEAEWLVSVWPRN